MTEDAIRVALDGSSVGIGRHVFQALLDNSPARERVHYRRALESGAIPFSNLCDLAIAGDFPYVLFFAPFELVESQIQRKDRLILDGFSKSTFALNSRSSVSLADVELIVKDLLRKQEALKHLDRSLGKCDVVGRLKKSRRTVERDADELRQLLGFSLEELHQTRGKTGAFDYLVRSFESRQLLVSQSQNNYMLQHLPKGRSFSGLCVRDPKVPYLFVTGGEDGSRQEPAGRRILTLVLLASLVARGKFTAVTFNSQTTKPFSSPEWELAEEVLMPESAIRGEDVTSLDAVKSVATVYRVTPSAVIMRCQRLKMVDHDRAADMYDTLREEYARVPKGGARSPLPTTAVRKYAGTELTRRMLDQVASGNLSPREFCRVVALNKLKPGQLPELRASLR